MVADGLAEAGGEVGAGGPAKFVARLVGIEGVSEVVAGAVRDVVQGDRWRGVGQASGAGGDFFFEDATDEAHKVEVCERVAATDIIGFAGGSAG